MPNNDSERVSQAPIFGQKMMSSAANLTLEQIQKTICCPSGSCSSPEDCYALRKNRDVPIRIDVAAEAILKLLQTACEYQCARGGSGVASLATNEIKPGIFIIEDNRGVPQDSAWQPQPDRTPTKSKG